MSTSSKPTRVARALAEAIVANDLRVGTLLPPENEMAKRYEVSRPVVREAIHKLAGAGLINTRHGVGSYITPPSSWNLFDPLVMEAYISTGNLPRMLNELIELRRLIEVESASIAAERISRAGLSQLADWLERMESVIDDPDETARADIAFHNTIADATENRFIGSIVGYLERALLEARHITSRAGGRDGRRQALDAHSRVLAALESADPARARQAMTAHIRHSEEDLRRAILQDRSQVRSEEAQ